MNITTIVIAAIGTFLIWIMLQNIKTVGPRRKRFLKEIVQSFQQMEGGQGLTATPDGWVDLIVRPENRETQAYGVVPEQPKLEMMKRRLAEKGIEARIGPSPRSKFGATALQVKKEKFANALVVLSGMDELV